MTDTNSLLKQIQSVVNSIVLQMSGYNSLQYPIAKILDMIFWEYGYNLL